MSTHEMLLEDDNLLLMQQLISNDWGALPLEELLFINPDSDREEITSILDDLKSQGYVEVLEEDTPEGVPSKFYTATTKAEEGFKELGLWDTMAVLYQVYNSLDTTNRIDSIREYYPEGNLK